jgi:ATP-dependent DNA helicase PIF1
MSGNCQDFYLGYKDYKCANEVEKSLVPDDQLLEPSSEFIPHDLSVYTSMDADERLLWRNLNSNRHVLISGKAGSGKSNLLQRFISHCPSSGFGFTHALCAPTGIAAHNIGGETLHRRLGLGLAQDCPVELYSMICKYARRYQKTWKFCRETDLLIIDEISMVDPGFFTTLDYLFRKVRNSPDPFGGVLLVLVGDFTQLGPVCKNKNNAKFVFQTAIWDTLNLSRFHLTRSYRQKDGDPFLELLNQVRVGNLDDDQKKLLRSRMNVESTDSKTGNDMHLEPIDIFPYRNMVKNRNNTKLNKLVKEGAEIRTFLPFLHIGAREHFSGKLNSEEQANAERIMKDSKQIDTLFSVSKLQLCVGAQVMMRCNHYMDSSIFNGSLGVITSINQNTVSVLFFVDGKFMKDSMDINRYQFRYHVGRSVDLIMDQFPLSLAWATTIHKVQGLTLDTVRLDARNCFENGQLYVALSRVRNLSDLFLIGFDEESVLTDTNAVNFEIGSESLEEPLKKKMKL